MEIKFRAWDKNEFTLCRVSNINLEKGCFLVGNSPTPDTIGDNYIISGTSEGHFVKFDDLELMQFTNKIDNLGFDVYEKDVIACKGVLYVIFKTGSGYSVFDLNSEINENYEGDLGEFHCTNLDEIGIFNVVNNLYSYKL